jgi:hypothetical protein
MDVTFTSDVAEVVVAAPVVWKETQLPDETVGRWIAAKAGTAKIASKEEIIQTLVPAAVLGALDEIGDRSIPQGIQLAEEKRALARDKQKVSSLGVEVRGEIAAVLAPLAALILVVALFVHLKNIRPINDEELLVVASFPWIGLFPDRLSRILTTISVILVPCRPTDFSSTNSGQRRSGRSLPDGYSWRVLRSWVERALASRAILSGMLQTAGF